MAKQEPFLLRKSKHWMRDVTSLANPIILVLIPFWIIGWNTFFIKLLLSLLINEVFCSLIKFTFHRQRPDGQTFNGAMDKIDAGSFPSIHSSRIMIAYLFLFSHSNNIWLGISFISIICLVGMSRVILKKHYISDVVGGLIIGGIIAYLALNYGPK